MTDETNSPATSSPPIAANLAPEPQALRYMQAWAESLSQVLAQIVGSPVSVECLPAAPPDAPSAEESDVRVSIVAAGGLRGEMSLRISRPAALTAAQVFMSEPQDAAAEFKPDHQEAVEELFRQVAGHAATALKPHWGEVQLRLEPGTLPSWSAGASGWLASGAESVCRLALEWQLSAALNAALAAASHPAESIPSQAASVDNAGEANFDLLKDVELEVTLRFGERSMLLRDILELGEGSVIELDREVNEPVDLLLDGKLIARGEVVVVDGNYGLRVQELLQPMAAQ
jgi:flagellar motor switch protein FliN